MTAAVETPRSWATGNQIRISPSSKKTYDACPRKWWYNKILGLPTPSTPATELGGDVHTCLEAYLDGLWDGRGPLTGRIASKLAQPRAEAIARAGIALSVPPLPGTVDGRETILEGKVSGRCGLLPYLGFVDFAECFFDPAEGSPDEPDAVKVTDHKSTSGYRFTPSPEQLATDRQMLFYVGALFRDPENPDDWPDFPISVAHGYYLTKAPEKGEPVAKRVETDTTWENVADVWRDYEATAQEMVWASEKRTPDEVACNPSACFDYNKPCPFSDRCSAFKNRANQLTVSKEPAMASAALERIRARREKADAEKAADAADVKTITVEPTRDQVDNDPVSASIQPDDAPTEGEATTVPDEVIAAFVVVVRKSPADLSDMLRPYAEGMLKRKGIATSEANIDAMVAGLDAPEPQGELALDAPSIEVGVDPGAPGGDTAVEVVVKADGVWDAAAVVETLEELLIQNGITPIDADVFKATMRDATPQRFKLSAKRRLEVKRLGQSDGLWSDDAGGGFVITALQEAEAEATAESEEREHFDATSTIDPEEGAPEKGHGPGANIGTRPPEGETAREVAERCLRVGEIEQHLPGCGHTLPAIVFVNCLPVGDNVETLDSYIADVADAVSAEVGHWRLPGFNEGRDKIIARLATHIASEGIPPFDGVGLYVDTGHPCAEGVIALLADNGAMIVRAIR